MPTIAPVTDAGDQAMADVDAAIRRYISNDIALSAPDISKSATSREWFMTRVANEIAARSTGAQLYATEPFVRFGSYFKGTKVRDVDEFDVLVVVDSNTGSFNIAGKAIGWGNGSAQPNHKYRPELMKADRSGVSPRKLLDWLHGIVDGVARSFGGVAPIRDGQAITARIASRDLAIDFVPAGVFTRHSDGSTFYNIPKGDLRDSWTVTSPRHDIELLDGVADGTPDLRNIIRIAKRIRDSYGLGISSFAIETAIVRYAQYTTWSLFLSIEVVYALRNLAAVIESGVIQDPYDAENNLIKDLSDRANCARLFGLVSRFIETLDKDETLTPDRLYETIRNVFEARSVS
jgi:hypothetical protein